MIQEDSPAFSSPVGNPTLNKSDRKTSCLKQIPKCSEKKSEAKRRSIKQLNFSSSPENKKRVRLCIPVKLPADKRDDLINLEQIETSETISEESWLPELDLTKRDKKIITDNEWQ